MSIDVSDPQRERDRLYRANRRRAAVTQGLCLVCCLSPRPLRRDGTQAATCRDCQAAANRRKRRLSVRALDELTESGEETG